MSTPADQAVRDLVSGTEGLGRTLFVEAGAGTGKTTQLVERIASLVLAAGVRLANIAAITFTEAAAAELQARIRVRFERHLTETTDPDERERAAEALRDADLAAVTTLHGFASRLLGEFAVEAGLPPRVRVVDEIQSQLAHEERWARFVDRLYDEPDHEALLVRTILLGVAFEPRYQGHATLKDLAGELNQHWDRLGVVAAQEPAPLRPVDFAPFDRAVETLAAAAAEGCLDHDDRFYCHLMDTVLPAAASIVATGDPERKLGLLAGLPTGKGKPWGRTSFGKAPAWVDLKGVKDHIDELNAAVAEVLAPVIDEVLRHLLIRIAREVLDAARARQAEGSLEFHDLLVLARDMLRTSAVARGALHGRYSHILLDEFQDTDPLQIELATLIAGTIVGDAHAGWRDVDVAAGRLFFVGDPKQSIYRFRRADIRLFLDARDRFAPDGSWSRLTTNFRTVEPILDWVNDLFAQLMAEEKAGSQPRYEPLHADRRPTTDHDHRPVLLGGPHPDPKVSAGGLREAEAADVAAAIADVRDHPTRWPVLDERTGEWRGARLGDVTVLVPTRTSLPYLRDALETAGLPYRLATGTLVYSTQEVRDALAALRAVDDPTDELSLIAALRSPLYACSDVDLFRYRRAGGRWDLRSDPPEAVAADDPVRSALAHLRTLWEDRWWQRPSALLGRLLADRQAFLVAFGDPRPTEVWRRLRFLVDQARSFEEAGGSDLRSFLDWADLQGSDSARVHEPLLPETDDDAVSILTVHGSKGLEFPITVLSGMTTQPGRPRTGVNLVWGDERPEVSLGKGRATADHDPRHDLEVEMDVDEKLRLLYVATTRARDHLVVSCHHNATKADTYAGRMWTHFVDRESFWRRLPEAGPRAAPEPPPAVGVVDVIDDREAWIMRRESTLAPERVPRAVSATAIARLAASDRSPDAADDADEVEEEGAAVAVRHRGRAGSAVGRAVHATLQVIDFDAPVDLDAQVRRQCDIESIPELDVTVTALVRSALASDAVQLAAARPHHRELYVAAPIGERMIEGYIDLLVETPEGLVVVDYKTDSARSEAEIDAKLAAYELQGAAYAVALEAVTRQPVVACRFVFCRASGAIERSVADLPAAMDRVRSSVASG